MPLGRLLVLVCVCACGRIGFDRIGDAGELPGFPDGFVPTIVQVTNLPGTNAHCPAIASDGQRFAVVWADARSGVDEIYFAQLDAAGTLLGGDVALTFGGPAKGCPAIVRSGLEYSIVFGSSAAGQDLFYTTYNPDNGAQGSLVQITNDNSASVNPYLATGAGGIGVTWEDRGGSGASIMFAVLQAPAGNFLLVPLTVANPGNLTRGPSAAYSSPSWGIAWADDSNGNLTVSFKNLIGGSMFPLVIAADIQDFADTEIAITSTGSSFGIMYRDPLAGSDTIMLTRVAHDGASLAAPAEVGLGHYFDQEAAIVWTTAGYALAYGSGGRVVLAYVSATGMVIGGGTLVTGLGTVALDPDLAAASSRVAVVWQSAGDVFFSSAPVP